MRRGQTVLFTLHSYLFTGKSRCRKYKRRGKSEKRIEKSTKEKSRCRKYKRREKSEKRIEKSTKEKSHDGFFFWAHLNSSLFTLIFSLEKAVAESIREERKVKRE